MSDGKKTDVPGAPLDDSVPTETPKLLQQDLGLDRRAPRPVPTYQLQPSGAPPTLANLKTTTPYFPTPAKVRELSNPDLGPAFAPTVIKDRQAPPSPLDYARTQPATANPLLPKPGSPGVAAPRAPLPPGKRPDPSLLQTDPIRTSQPAVPAAQRPAPLRQQLGSRPLAPPVATPALATKAPDVVTEPMPRSAVPAARPGLDPMLTRTVHDVPTREMPKIAALAIQRTEVSRPMAQLPLPPIERTEVSRPMALPPAPAPEARTDLSRALVPPPGVPISSQPPTQVSRPPPGVPLAAAPPAPTDLSRPPGVAISAAPFAPTLARPAPLGVPMNPRSPAPTTPMRPATPTPAARPAASGPTIDAAPIVRPPQGPQVTPSPARKVSQQDLTPVPPKAAPVAAPSPAPKLPVQPATLQTPVPRPAPQSFKDLPAAMEKPRTLGPEFATTQPGIPGPYFKRAPGPKTTPVEVSQVPSPGQTGPDESQMELPSEEDAFASEQAVDSDQVLARPASLWRRTLSWVFDLAVIGGAVVGLLLLAVTVIGAKAVPNNLHGIDAFFFKVHPIAIPALGLTVLIAVLYTTLGAFLLRGRTLGRLLLGIRLVDESGQAPGLIRSLLRAVFSIASFAFFLAGFWLALFDRHGQTLHDKLTRTFVVRPV